MKIFSVEGSPRAAAITSCYTRLIELLGAPQDTNQKKLAPGDVLRDLEDRGLVYRMPQDDAGEGLYYLPSVAAKTFLSEWLEAADTALTRLAKKALKPRQGALITFPLYPSAPNTEPRELHCFTTDWSPFPAACAIAVHPHHPLAPKGKELPAFTGAYVRHPLHGDLMPVWAVDWVAPDIGTGVVIVNPAHCAADLSFARDVGLPIRFGLVPAIPGTSSDSWIEPPVIRTGTGFRTGSSADGLPHGAAAAQYFSTLEAEGRARTITEYALGSQKIAASAPGTGNSEPESPFVSMLEFLNAYANTTEPGSWMTVLDREMGALEVARLVCLAVDCGFSLPALSKTIFVGAAETEGGESTDTPAGQLACLSASAPADALSVKQETMEQAERFIANLSVSPEIPNLSDKDFAKGAKRSRKVVEHMTGGELHLAFRELYRLQRDIRRDQGVGKADKVTYPALAYVMSGEGVLQAENDVRRLLSAYIRP
ncbi:hypothetical protein [Desulfoluna spongiiphila]|uniref:hypothetical protein n=1 Tax=Desulfoluna spongiiphila TaxID=419481 RepID=UPI0012512A60|nr:hypothetical protein [Desulfoluna spongiiphila]VVS93822.1 valyl/leucyl/isoleucyl-trna synthetase editing domain [Desulfoluna spongiiphila]